MCDGLRPKNTDKNYGFDMFKLDQLRKFLATIANVAAPRPSPRFSCGDCERNEKCGLPPHEDCEFRIMQVVRDGDYRSRRPDYLYPAVWPH
jgi:hypothetical protein